MAEATAPLQDRGWPRAAGPDKECGAPAQAGTIGSAAVSGK